MRSVVLGSRRKVRYGGPAAAHAYLGVLAGVFVALHGLALALDSSMAFTPVELLVPLATTYRPGWTALGIIAAELPAALAVTSRLRRCLPYVLWRRLHGASFAVSVLAAPHGIGAGTGGGRTATAALYAGACPTVTGALAWRLLGRSTRTTGARRRQPVGTPRG